MLSMFLLANSYINLENNFIIIMIFVGTYVLGTEIFTPDLDIDSKPGQRLGILSYPIRKLSKHRGLGHNIFIGWLLKTVYILLIILCIWMVIYCVMLNLGLEYNISWLDINIKMIYAFLIGLFLSNAVHIMTDKLL